MKECFYPDISAVNLGELKAVEGEKWRVRAVSPSASNQRCRRSTEIRSASIWARLGRQSGSDAASAFRVRLARHCQAGVPAQAGGEAEPRFGVLPEEETGPLLTLSKITAPHATGGEVATKFLAQPGEFGWVMGGQGTWCGAHGCPSRLLFQGIRERRRVGFAGVGGSGSSTGSSTSVPRVKKSQRFGCSGRAWGSVRDGSGFLVRLVRFSGIEGTGGLRGMPG